MRLFRPWRVYPKTRSARKRGEKAWYRTEEFLKLRKKWYGKLKKSGFDDLEYTNWDTGQPSPFVTRGSTADLARKYKPAVARYYELANQFLWEMREKPGRWKKGDIPIWREHAAGKTAEQIAGIVDLHFDTVAKRLKRLEPYFQEYCRQKAEWDRVDAAELEPPLSDEEE